MSKKPTQVDRLLNLPRLLRRRRLPSERVSTPTDLRELAQVSGQITGLSDEQRQYHIDAESAMDVQWQAQIWPMLEGMDFSVVVDLAAGYGRNSVKLLEHADELIIADINEECIKFCRRRFAGDERIRYLRTDGASLSGIDDASVTLVYCFDAMVHFDSDVVRAYIREFDRVLRTGGTCFCHHSNYTGQPGGGVRGAPHSRNFMSAELFAHYSIKAGLQVRTQCIMDWGDGKELDCISILEKRE